MTSVGAPAGPVAAEPLVPGHLPQLDGLRAVAVSLVLVHHWVIGGGELGVIGVQLFFVLSGFLITRILLDLRAPPAASPGLALRRVGRFYVRRMLRIFPIFYLTILFFLVIGRFGIDETYGWHLLYLSNVLFFVQGEFGGPFSHFWSLAVEEQFYLAWPWLVVFLPRRALPAFIIATIAIAPLTRTALVASGYVHFAQYATLPLANLDTLGLGALLAWAGSPGFASDTARRRFEAVVAVMAVVYLVTLVPMRAWAGPAVLAFWDSTARAFVLCWIVRGAGAGFRGPAGALLQSTPLVSVGRISYGVYVYHMFAPAFLRNALDALALPASLAHGPVGFVVLLAATLLVATLSWRLVERPIMGLKRRFPYTTGARADRPDVRAAPP